MRQSINLKIPQVTDELFNAFMRFDESINGLVSNCNEIVTDILQSYQMDNLVVFNQDVESGATSVLEFFQSFSNHSSIKEIVEKHFLNSFDDIQSELRKKLLQLIKYIDNNDTAYQCYIDVKNNSVSKMFVVFQKDFLNTVDVITHLIKNDSLIFQNSVTVTVSTMKSDLEACLNKGSATVSCLNDYVSI